MINAPISILKDPTLLFQSQLYLAPEQVSHNRKVYDINQLLGDLGGITGVLTLILGFLISPISEASFIMMSAKRMFLVRTKHNELFEKPATKKSIGKHVSCCHEYKHNRVINLKTKDRICVYIQNILGSAFCCQRCWPNHKKLTMLFDCTQARLKQELDIVKLVRNTRNSKSLLKNSLMSPEIKRRLSHTDKNLVDIDTSSDEENALQYTGKKN